MPAVLTVDAGFTATGWAVIDAGKIVAAGCIRTEKSERRRAVRVADDDAERCALIARELVSIVRTYDAKGIVAELPTAGAKSARATVCMARASTVLAVVAELLHLPAEWVTPTDVKHIAGRRKVSKAQVEAAVLKRWPRAPLPKLLCEREHVADALAAFIAAENGVMVRTLHGAGSSKRRMVITDAGATSEQLFDEIEAR